MTIRVGVNGFGRIGRNFYRALAVQQAEGKATDIFLSAALDGAPANWYAPSLVKAGIDLDELAVTHPGKIVTSDGQSKQRYKGIWSAGHGIGATREVVPVHALCEQLINEYEQARADLRRQLA